MDSVINSTNVYSTKTALDEFFEQKVDFDIVLPDYCPAAKRILKCDVTAGILSKTADNEKLTLDIQCKARVVYVDDSTGSVHSVTKTENFSKTLSLKIPLSVSKIRTALRASSVNCRLQNSRRISVKSVVGTAVKIIGNCECQIIGEAHGGGIESDFNCASANILCGVGDTPLQISGQLMLDSGITEIISSDASLFITDTKVITDKIIIKGEAALSIVYMTGEGTCDFKFYEGTVPFSEVIDVYGATENALCDTQWEIYDVRCELSDDNGGVLCEIDASISASVYNNCEIKMLKDVYSMTDSLDITKTNLLIESFKTSNTVSENISGSIPCDFSEARIIGVCANAFVKNIALRDDSFYVDGEMNVTVYMCNEEDYGVIEKSIPFSVSRPAGEYGENMRCEAALEIKNLSYSMPNDDTITINAEAEITLNCFVRDTYTAIDTIEITEAEQSLCKGVVLYYGERGEMLWDIAKKYRSSVDIIKRDNKIESDRLTDDKMLVIAFN